MKCVNKDCNCHIFHEDMVNEAKETLSSDDEYTNISEFFKILSDPNRLKLIEATKENALCVCDIGHLLGVTKSAISHQMKLLKSFNLIESKKEGKMVYYKFNNNFVINLIDKTKGFLGGQDEKNN